MWICHLSMLLYSMLSLGETFCSLLVTIYSLLISFSSLLVTFCLLFVTFCSMLAIFCRFLFTFYLLFITFYLLLVAFCLLLVTFYSLLDKKLWRTFFSKSKQKISDVNLWRKRFDLRINWKRDSFKLETFSNLYRYERRNDLTVSYLKLL